MLPPLSENAIHVLSMMRLRHTVGVKDVAGNPAIPISNTFATSRILADGKIDTGEWKASEKIAENSTLVYFSGKSDPANNANISALYVSWTAKYFYAAIEGNVYEPIVTACYVDSDGITTTNDNTTFFGDPNRILMHVVGWDPDYFYMNLNMQHWGNTARAEAGGVVRRISSPIDIGIRSTGDCGAVDKGNNPNGKGGLEFRIPWTRLNPVPGGTIRIAAVLFQTVFNEPANGVTASSTDVGDELPPALDLNARTLDNPYVIQYDKNGDGTPDQL